MHKHCTHFYQKTLLIVKSPETKRINDKPFSKLCSLSYYKESKCREKAQSADSSNKQLNGDIFLVKTFSD